MIKNFLEKKILKQSKFEKNLEKKVLQKKNHYPIVSIIIPNRNGRQITLECLESLKKLNYPKSKLEIIISDNGSNDGSIEMITEQYNKMNKNGWLGLKLVKNGKNIGAAPAYDTGYKIVNKNYDYIWKLDNDVELDENALIEQMKIMLSSNKIGIVGGKVFYPQKKIIWSLGGKLFNKMGGLTIHIGKNKKDCNLFNNIYSFDILAGCSILINKHILKKTNGFLADYFVYLDDVELSYISIKNGYKNIYTPKSIIIHKVSQTTKPLSTFGLYYQVRNSIIFNKRNYKKNYIISIIINILIRYKTFFKNPISFIKTVKKAVKDGYNYKP